MEMDFAKNDNDRLTSVEDRVLSVKNELDQMKNLLLKQNEKSSEQFNELKSFPIIPLHPSVPNLGFDVSVPIISIFQSYLILPKEELNHFFRSDHMRMFA